MLDRSYRQRLEADLAQWEADGVIALGVAAAIRVASGRAAIKRLLIDGEPAYEEPWF